MGSLDVDKQVVIPFFGRQLNVQLGFSLFIGRKDGLPEEPSRPSSLVALGICQRRLGGSRLCGSRLCGSWCSAACFGFDGILGQFGAAGITLTVLITLFLSVFYSSRLRAVGGWLVRLGSPYRWLGRGRRLRCWWRSGTRASASHGTRTSSRSFRGNGGYLFRLDDTFRRAIFWGGVQRGRKWRRFAGASHRPKFAWRVYPGYRDIGRERHCFCNLPVSDIAP